LKKGKKSNWGSFFGGNSGKQKLDENSDEFLACFAR
jgi:hypothetical protein